ncbi:MAG TPA: NADAR family protein [Candidatus Limnocylindria bacterium]|nr:NADAR family protein [Candidatus Limnocylindria bacterium]
MERPAQFRDPDLDVSGDRICFYPREFYVFDNFASFQVDYMGRRWATSEHAYQASHFFDTAPQVAEAIFEARSAHDAYKLARAHVDKVPEDWEDRKAEVMYGICRLKLAQNPYVWQKLLETGDLDIVEDSTKDAFWGWGPNRDGRNELGKIWMRLRGQVRSGEVTELET